MRYGITAEFTGGGGDTDLATMAREWINERARQAGITVNIENVMVETLEDAPDTGAPEAPRPLASAGKTVDWGEGDTPERTVRRKLKAIADVNARIDNNFANRLVRQAEDELARRAGATDVAVTLYQL